jgi:hypothetical protein
MRDLMYRYWQEYSKSLDACQSGVNQKQEKRLVVEKPHSVDYPQAVVIHLEHTRAHHAAVMRPGWLPCLTAPAEVRCSGYLLLACRHRSRELLSSCLLFLHS